MNNEEYLKFRTAIEDTFISLYAIDVGSLTASQRVEHQAALSAAYDAVIRLENKAFEDLTEKANTKLTGLQQAASELQASLAGLKKANETLATVSAALSLFTSIAKILK